MNPMPVELWDAAALGLSMSLVIVYHFYLRVRLQSDAQFTVHATNNSARARWVEAMMSARGQEVLAIQTLRNSVMTASFMASTAVLLMIATLTLIVSQDPGASVLHALNVSGATDDRAVAVKLVLLIFDFFAAFFCFSMAVRYFNHVGYMITVQPDAANDRMPPARVALYLNRAGNFYAFGTRTFFYCVPLVFWMFGPSFLVAATVVLLIALYPFDRPPRGS
jgi:uncharacterized membrane protein